MTTAFKHKSWNSFQGLHWFSTIILAAIILAPGSCASAQVVRINSISSFAISSSPASLTATAGGASISSTVNVSPLNSFKGTVSLAVTGVPAEVTAALNESTASAGSSVTLTATAGATAKPGTYPLTITGTSGITKNSATVELIIPSPSFSLAASAKSVTLLVGQDGWNLPVNISEMNASGLEKPVSLSVSGVPANVKSAFTSVNATTQGLTFNVGSTAVPGTYAIKVSGTSGSITSTTTVALVIPSPSFTISPTISAFTLLPGGNSGISIINVVGQNGFAGSVNFSLSGVPTGVNGSLSAASSDYKTGLILTPGSTPAPGTYNVVITGKSGSLTSTASIVVTVPTPSFSLASSPNALTATAGGSYVTSTISVANPSAASSGVVSVAVSGAPAGVTASLNESTATSSSPVRLSVTAASNAVPGTYPLTITGALGATTNSTTVELTVPKPSFSLSASANAITLTVGQNGWNLPIDISILNQVGLAGPVNLSASGVPSGVTSAFTGVNSTTQGLTFNVGAAATPGTYDVTVIGKSGSVTSSVPVVLTIPSPSFSLSPSVAAMTLVPGAGSASSVINVIDQSGFSGSVVFSVSGVPTGVNASLSAASSAFKSGLVLTPESSAVAGTYIVVVTGTSGQLTGSATIVVTVPPPSFTLSSSPSTLALLTGGSSETSKITVSGIISSSASMVLSATGLPAGVTAAFPAAASVGQASVTFAASSAAAPGTYIATVQGTCGGTTKSTTVALTISAPAFSISSSSSSLTLPLSGSASTTISVSGLSSSSSVSLAAAGVPAGVTAAFSAATTSSTSSLTFTASSSAVAGTYSISVNGTSGSASSSASVSLTVKGAQSGSPTAIAITQPTFGFNVLPGSVRRIFATVTNGVTNGVNWSVNGGATLSATTGNWVDVTAPAAGSSCSINGTNTYTVNSAKQFTLTAQSQENSSKTASITINVCNPVVQVQVVPFYTTLYAEQKADIQAFVWGSVNRNVTWAITAQPNGGDGALADSANEDTVFSATVAGRYTLTATSAADGTKTNTATIYVTGHSMPYAVTPSQTMPVDCTVDPALTGTTYDVGPSQKYKTIQSVPWTSLTAGSTIRIHNEDTTGASPSTYHEYFQVTTHASRTQPVRICGVPDSRGNLPVVDASNSTGSSKVSVYAAGYAAVGIGTTGWAGVYTGTWTGSQDLIVEGIKIQNAKPPYSYTTPSGTAGTAWPAFTACIRIFPSMDTVIRGVDAFNCGLGFFSDFNANNGYAVVANTLYEGNHLHQNGVSGQDGEHQFYIQGWNELVQFNLLDDYQSGASGSNFKGRGYPEIVRYNHFGDGAARQLDFVDNQDAQAYTSFEGYLSGGSNSIHAIYPTDQYTADLLAAAVEAHHADYAYGNTFINTTAAVPVHYSTDHGSLEDDRIGTLWFYNNSFYEPECSPCANYSWALFDTGGGGGDFYPEIEWPQIQALNNAIWLDSPTQPYFAWNNAIPEFTYFGKTVINSNWGTGNMAGGLGTGWVSESSPYPTSPYSFQGASNSSTTSGVANIVGTSKEPFNVTTFAPNSVLVNAGSSLPASVSKFPVRFEFGPSAAPTPRTQPLTVGAME
jgi:uncharacterized membrane protein